MPRRRHLETSGAARTTRNRRRFVGFYVAKGLQGLGLVSVGFSIYLGVSHGQSPNVSAFVIGLGAFYSGRLLERFTAGK